MKLYPVKTPKIVQNVFGNFIWKMDPSKNPDGSPSKEIYLTFDDGPTPEITPWVLKTLSEYQAKATFFCIGKNVKNHPKIFQKVIEEGHAVGNHTFNHLNGWKSKTSKYLLNIDKVEKKFRSFNLNGQDSNTQLFRPPYGRIKPKQARKILNNGYKIIMWNVLSGDFDHRLTKEDCYQNTIRNPQSGSIMVFHDSEKAFKNLHYSLPKTLKYYSDQGFQFKALYQ